MTISSSTSKNTYAGDGSTTVFPYTFRILDDDEVLIQIKSSTGVLTDQTKTTHYTVSGVGAQAGGNITMITAPASGETLVISRSMTFQQGTDYSEADAFPAETHEEALDELTMNDQQLKEGLDRAIKPDIAVSGFDGTLPDPGSNTSKVLRYNSAGTAIEAVTMPASGAFDLVDDPSPQAGADLDMNGYDLQFDDGTGIQDDSGNEQVTFQKTASAVNELEVTNAATGNGPILGTSGDDTDIDLNITPKGTGDIYLNSDDVFVEEDIVHIGDTDNKISFGTDTQDFQTGGSSRLDISDSGVRLGASGARVTTVLDEDTLSSDSATALATQQSIKAYVDASAPTSDYELIATATASNDAAIDFTGLSSTYFMYKLVIANVVPASDGVSLAIRTSTDGGATYDSAAGHYAYGTFRVDSSSTGYDASASSTILTLCVDIGSDTNESVSGEISLYNPSGTEYTHASGNFIYENSAGSVRYGAGGGYRLSAADVDAVRVLFTSGNIESGSIKLYGLKAS